MSGGFYGLTSLWKGMIGMQDRGDGYLQMGQNARNARKTKLITFVIKLTEIFFFLYPIHRFAFRKTQ
jgi:hypothetical protein